MIRSRSCTPEIFGNRHFLLVAARQFDDLHVIVGGACLERTYLGHQKTNANDPKRSLAGSLLRRGSHLTNTSLHPYTIRADGVGMVKIMADNVHYFLHDPATTEKI